MKPWMALPLFATALAALNPSLFAQSTNHWRVFTQTDGLAESACYSVTLGASGNVLVRHLKSANVSVLDGYEVTVVPGPGTWRNRVYESPGGQLWSVVPSGLQEFREGQWVSYDVPEIAGYFQAGRTNEIPLLPVRQGRVLILLPDRLLLLEAEDPERPRVELLLSAAQTAIGPFKAMTHTRDVALWISGERGFEMHPGPARNLKPDETWLPADAMPPELLAPRDLEVSADELSVRKIYDVAVEPSGTVWVATSEGLFRRAPMIWETTDRSTIPRPEARSPKLPPDLPADIAGIGGWRTYFNARNGDVWLGGKPAIAWHHQDSWRVFSSTNQVGPEDVTAFAESPDGRIRCATPTKVWEFDGRNWLELRGGFARINALGGTRDGTLWVATDNGLFRHTQNAWIANGREDGLPASVVYAITEDSTGTITATTPAGMATFNAKADLDPPRTFILSDSAGDDSFREGSMITLSFRGRDKWKLTAASRLLFSYRLDEREWSPFQEINEISFTDLSLGKHYFQVRAMDRNANIDPRPARLEFAVFVPWYRETRLVLILSVALGVALFFAALAMNRHRKLRLSYAEVERKIAERTRELEIANRELLHSQKMNALGTLAAGIAHDFNNILSIVKGSAQIIEDNLDNPGKIQTRLERIKTVVQQGAGIVEAMLGFSRSSDQSGLSKVDAVVEDTLKLLGDRFLRETEIRFERNPQLPEISVARDFVQQVLLNFIFNAAEAMDRRSPERPDSSLADRQRPEPPAASPTARRKQIDLSTSIISTLPEDIFLTPSPANSYIVISVRDHGSGIAPEIKPRIFEPFFTTKALSTKRGTGLGLSMVYELARKMEAGLAVESAVGEGSTFTLILPVKSSPASWSPSNNKPPS